MSQNRPLVEKIIDFLHTEKELYGPFGTSGFKGLSSEAAEAEAPQVPDQKKQNITEEISQPDIKVSSTPPVTTPEMCSTLDELRNLCENTIELRTDLEGTKLVFGVGNPQADLMLIGEAPGAEEDQQGEPFVGAAGQLLNKIISAVQFRREDVYIANILKHRPPGNRNPNPEEIEKSLPFLIRQIELIQPKLILTLGKISATALLGEEQTIKSLRGKFHSFRGTELMVTYHPAALLRDPKWKRPVWEDVQLLRERYDALGGKP
jgi:DNA polymerase